MYSHLSFLNCILFLTCPGQLPGLKHFSGAPGLFSIACLHLHIDTTLAFILEAISRIRSSLPPQAHTRIPIVAPWRSGNSTVTRIAPVVLVVGASNVVDFPVKAPPMMISPYFPSIPPAFSIISPTLTPTGTSKNTCASFPPFNLPRTVMFLLIQGFFSSTASAILQTVSTLTTTDLAADGSCVVVSNTPRHSLTTARSSPIG